MEVPHRKRRMEYSKSGVLYSIFLKDLKNLTGLYEMFGLEAKMSLLSQELEPLFKALLEEDEDDQEEEDNVLPEQCELITESAQCSAIINISLGPNIVVFGDGELPCSPFPLLTRNHVLFFHLVFYFVLFYFLLQSSRGFFLLLRSGMSPLPDVDKSICGSQRVEVWEGVLGQPSTADVQL